MARRMYRYEVPIDDMPHTFPLSLMRRPVAVAATKFHVEFWCEFSEEEPAVKHTFQVFGTNRELPDDAKWVGTTARTAIGLVWHLYEVTTYEAVIQ